MGHRITKAEGRTFRRRWEAMDAVVKGELRKTPIARKLDQLNALMAWGRYFGWIGPRVNGAAEIRRRWIRLFRVYRG